MQAGFAETCRVVCEEQGWELLPTGVLVRFDDGRRQLVSIELFEFEDESLVRLSSIIGPSDGMSHEELVTALHSNADLAHGALAIRDAEFMLVETLTIEGLGRSALTSAIEFLAQSADETERVIHRTDDH